MTSGAGSGCKRCGGTGFVRIPPNPRYPNGASAICPCRARLMRRRRLEALMARSGLSEEVLERWSFDTFDPRAAVADAAGRSRLAQVVARCRAYAEAPVGWLVLMGPCGCGKTHLAYAMAGLRYRAGEDVCISTVPDLLEALREGYAGGAAEGSAGSFEERFSLVRDVGLLVLDDLGAQHDTPWTAEKLYQIIDHRYRHRLPLVVTTNVNLYDARGAIEGRVLSRLLDGANTPEGFSRVVLIQAGDYRLRAGGQRG